MSPVLVSRRGGRPPVQNPLDQKITITVTLEEYESIKLETSRANSPSLAAFIRSRINNEPDIKGWGQAARKALKELEADSLLKLETKKKISSIQKEKDLAIREENQEEVDRLTEELIILRDKITGSLPVPRKARLITRVSTVDRERIVHQANKLNLSISDYARLKIFSYEPGEEGDHLSNNSKRKFYTSVTLVEGRGWGLMPQVSSNLCPNCGSRV